MGYRNKISLLEKSKHEEIKDMTIPQLCKWFGVTDPDDNYVPCYELSEEIYELGKYCDLDYLKPFRKPVFSKKNTHAEFNREGEFVIIGQDGLKAIIEDYHKKILSYFESLLNPSEYDKTVDCVTTPQMHIESKIRTWGKNCRFVKPYDLDLKTQDIVGNWEYEYTIFELVRLYKTIDFNKYELCLTGW